SSAPASDVTSPPSKAASKARPSTTPKSNRSALHSVGIGALLGSEKSRCCTTTFADSRPGAPQLCEKCGLAFDQRGGAPSADPQAADRSSACPAGAADRRRNNSMNLHTLLAQRAAGGRPVRVGLIG